MKDATTYSYLFRHAAAWLDQEQMIDNDIQWAVGEVLNSVYLKLYKSAWSNTGTNALTAPTRIFFSVWINDRALEEKIIHYNIHAFKLRQLKGYAIESRKFAAVFRETFQPFMPQWQNISIAYGPLTLMEGWCPIDPEHFQHVVAGLANQFLSIAPLIDQALERFKK